MVTYDPRIIQQFVERLYKRAKMIVITSTIGSVLVGGIIGFVAGLLIDSGSARLPRHVSLDELGAELIACFMGALVFGLIGFMAGRERAFLLRLQAQTALCQVKIEENTRSSSRELFKEGTDL